MCRPDQSARKAQADLGRYITLRPYCWFSRWTAHISYIEGFNYFLKRVLIYIFLNYLLVLVKQTVCWKISNINIARIGFEPGDIYITGLALHRGTTTAATEVFSIVYEPVHEKRYKLVFLHSICSDQQVHLLRFIRICERWQNLPTNLCK